MVKRLTLPEAIEKGKLPEFIAQYEGAIPRAETEAGQFNRLAEAMIRTPAPADQTSPKASDED
jgi:hypothetical protein